MWWWHVFSNLFSAPPLLQDLDIGVIQSLPPELFSELNEMYGGKLGGFISQSKMKSENGDSSPRISSREGNSYYLASI